MSDRPERTVYACPPGKSPAPHRAVPAGRAAEATSDVLPSLTSSAAINAFLELLRVWKMPPARCWRMLTGVGYRAGLLTPDQIARVQHLMTIDAGMRKIHGDNIGEWMVTGNGAAMLFRSSPIDFLTHAGIVGYAALTWQVGIWARM